MAESWAAGRVDNKSGFLRKGLVIVGSQVDVYFLSDSTGSMAKQPESVQRSAASILERLRARGADVWFGVGNYKDFDGASQAFDAHWV